MKARMALFDKTDGQYSQSKQCELLGINKSTLYYVPVPVSREDLEIMALLDMKYTARPYYGVRRMTVYLTKDEGYVIGKDHVRTLLRRMGIMALFPTRNLSKPNPAHKIYPYLLKGVEVTRSNQVWSIDITYIRLAHGFAYLVAVIDWYSRRVLSWRLSNTLESDFCIEALEESMALYGTPEIFNSDQGSQFTSESFTSKLIARNVKISMDGRGRAYDNIFIERLWRSVKYEDIYLRQYQNIPECKTGLGEYFRTYDVERRHQALDYKTPREVYFEGIENCGVSSRDGERQSTLRRA